MTAWIGPLIGVALGWLMASSLVGGFGLDGPRWRLLPPLLLGAAVVVFVTILRRRQARRAPPASLIATPPPAATVARPAADSSLADGLRDIRRMDPKFDPARFTGYIEMVFRTTHDARMSGDFGALRDRVTPQLYGELRAQRERVGSLENPSGVEPTEIRAEVTQAWQEDGRDYVTAHIAADARGESADAFWTFTRPAGLNPWMLSAIRTTSSGTHAPPP